MSSLIEIVNNLDRTDSDTYDSPDWDKLAEYFSIDGLYWLKDTRLKSYWMQVWYCTDTYVGTKAYFLDEEFVCISHQGARKSNTEFAFVSKEAADKVRTYLESFVLKEESEIELIENGEMDEEYSVSYSSQILLHSHHKFARYIKTDEIVQVVWTPHGYEDMHSVEILQPNGNKLKIHCKDLRFKYGGTYEK